MIRRLIILVSIVTFNSVILIGQADTIQPIKLDFELVSVSCCNDYNDLYMENHGTEYSNMIGILKLFNQTDTAFTFWIMICSWTDLVKIEPDSIKLEVKECDKNHPEKITLESNQSLSFNSIIEIPSEYFDKSVMLYDAYRFNTFNIRITNGMINDSIVEIPSDSIDKSVMLYDDYKFNTFRIGFIIINENEYTPYPNPWNDWHNLIDDKMKKNQFIWTQPIVIEYSVYKWKINK